MLVGMPMYKKIGLIGIVTMLLLVSFIPTGTSIENVNVADIKPASFGNTTVTADWDTEALNGPLIPGGDAVNVTVNLSLKGVISKAILSKIFLPLLKNKEIVVDLEVVDIPEWAEVTIDVSKIKFPINAALTGEASINVSIKVKENAPAIDIGSVKINITTAPVKVLFDAITLIDGTKSIIFQVFSVAYMPDLEIPKIEDIEFTPYNQTTIPIKIISNSNDETTVYLEFIDVIEGFNMSLDTKEVTLAAFGGETIVNFTIEPDHNLDNISITIGFEPVRTSNPEEKGMTEYLTITLNNDGSYVEPEDDKINIDTNLIIIILVIILIIAIALLLIFKRKPKA